MSKYLKVFDTNIDYSNWENSEEWITPNVAFIKDSNNVTFNPHIPPVSDPFNGHEYVDLGLPSGTLWAKCNIGAEKESDYGLYFAWGETVGYKDVSSGKNFTLYDYELENGDTCDGIFTKYDLRDGLTTLEPPDDAATVNMGGSWRMPTESEFNELLSNTTNTWTTVEGVYGKLFTGNNGNTLFFPTSGFCDDGYVGLVGSDGNYWSSSLSSSNLNYGLCLSFSSGYCGGFGLNRYQGLPVRGVIS